MAKPFKDMSVEERREYAELMFLPLDSAEELRNWILEFFGLDMPIGHIDPDSNSSPVEAMWEIYDTIKNNKGEENPGYIMLSAREGYKCQAKGSKLLTPKGLINIEDVKVGDTVWTGFSWQKVNNWIDDGEKEGIEVKLKGGLVLTGSPIHRYWGLRNGVAQWLESKDLNPTSDLICVNVNTGLQQKEVLSSEEYEIGYFLGLLIGDGSVSAIESKTHCHFALTTIDPYIKDFFYKFVKNNMSCDIKKAPDNITYAVWNKKAIEKIKIWGIEPKRSWEKTVPQSCYGSLDRMKGFIAGVFDTDGSFSQQGDAILSITSPVLIQELQKILASLGIYSTIRSNKKLYSNQKHLVHTLSIGQWEVPNIESNGIIFRAKKANSFVRAQIPNTHDTISISNCIDFIDLCNKYGHIQIRNRKFIKKGPYTHYKGISRHKLLHLCDWMQENYEHGLVVESDFESVKKYREILKNRWESFETRIIPTTHFYDLTVENDHSYWSNGAISHNTLSASILEALLMVHFQITIAHLAAVQSQSAKAIQYINYFFNKIEPMLSFAGWEKTSENKSKISYKTDKGEDVYIKVVVATMAGANSEHTNMMFVDEIDVVGNPQAYEEAKLIPGYAKGLHPVTVKLSTRKFSFGLMQKELDLAPISGDKILRWNLLDVTERCAAKRHKPNQPTTNVYVAKALPLRQILPEEYLSLPDAEKPKWELLEQTYAGCSGCKLLPVCKMRLAERDEKAVRGLYKPVGAVVNTFKKTNPDMAEAQLMCWKPGTKGTVYPRFESTLNTGNVITLEFAWETLTGVPPRKTKISEIDLFELMKTLGIQFYAGVDWGYTHDFVLVFFAMIPNGEVWIVDCYSMPGLEFSDCLEIAKNYRDKFYPHKWYPDQAMPSHIKSFNKNGMKCQKFTKDIMGGIEAIRSKIITGSGKRLLKVLFTEANQKVISAFQKHHFKLDAAGNPTITPDDDPGVADQADAIRYVAQNLFPMKGSQRPMLESAQGSALQQYQDRQSTNLMREEIAKRITAEEFGGGSGKKGGFHWSM